MPSGGFNLPGSRKPGSQKSAFRNATVELGETASPVNDISDHAIPAFVPPRSPANRPRLRRQNSMATGIDRCRDYRERSISAELRIRPTMPREQLDGARTCMAAEMRRPPAVTVFQNEFQVGSSAALLRLRPHRHTWLNYLMQSSVRTSRGFDALGRLRVDPASQFAEFYVENDGQFTGPRPIQELYDLIELSTGSLEYIQNRYSGCAFETRKSRAGKSIPVLQDLSSHTRGPDDQAIADGFPKWRSPEAGTVLVQRRSGHSVLV